jgi:hypothetical protein
MMQLDDDEVILLLRDGSACNLPVDHTSAFQSPRRNAGSLQSREKKVRGENCDPEER